MKKWFALLLACILALSVPMTSLAETVVYPSITVTFKAFDKKTEEAFRVWASSIINSYLTYANAGGLEIAGHGFYDHFNEITRLINEYDLEDTKVRRSKTWYGGHTERKYTSLNPYGTEEESEEMRKARKQVFMKMIAETMQEKCTPSSTIYSDIQKREIGKTMVYDSSKGRFVYSSAYTYMDGQDYVAFTDEFSTALLDSASAATNMLINYYFKYGKGSALSNKDTLKDTFKAISNVLYDTADAWKSEVLKNATNQLINLTNEAISEEIAACISMADESMVKYITKEWIDSQTTQYGSMDQFRMTYGNDVNAELLKEAAEEAIALYRQYKGDPSAEVTNIQKGLEDYFQIEDLEIDGWNKILNVTILTACKGFMSEGLGLLRDAMITDEPEFKSDGAVTIIGARQGGGLYADVAIIIGAIQGTVESFFDALIASESGTGTLDWNNVMSEMKKAIENDTYGKLAEACGKVVGAATKNSHVAAGLDNTDKLYEAVNKTLNGDSDVGRAWYDWIVTAVPKAGASIDIKSVSESMFKKFEKNLEKTEEKGGKTTPLSEWCKKIGEKIENVEALKNLCELLSVVDVKAWTKVSAGIWDTIDAIHDDRTNKSQASFTSTELYIALKSVSLRQHNALKALLTDNANAAYDSRFGPQNVLDPKLTSTEGIAAILCKIFTEYNTNLTALGAYKTLVNGNSDVMEYIRKHSKKQGGFPFVSDKDLDVCIKVFSAVNSYKEKQSSYAQYF